MLYATVRQRKIHVKNPVTVIQNGIGVDRLTLDMDEEWKDMTSIVCVFTTKYTVEEEQTETEEEKSDTTEAQTEAEGDTAEEETKKVTVEKEIVKEMLHTFGEPLLVPWENLKETGKLSVSCTGYVGDTKVMTTMMPDSFWDVVQNGPVTGETPMEPTATLYEQVVAAAGVASAAAETANAAAVELRTAKENGAFDGISPTVELGTVTIGTEAQVTNSGTPQAAVFDFVLPRGIQGPKGDRGFPGRDGKDAEVTAESITAALGYTPMAETAGMAGQFAVSDGNGGISWVSLTNVGEVGA